ncbi:hypothetical protein RxyAA322_27980 [Rubrobacter xylanophilus]|uniref:Uncharacterized protein n=1 Tax=Rubrobacter xylanophilus TaxID=49319 RepID=A0A510HM16_9ACTN|nr:hypothetical protein [Rubrobacter xylanophilus]BBL80944.1 hypothetical protein RxyAA322_27980 [Rubrobacter xylanophilus]
MHRDFMYEMARERMAEYRREVERRRRAGVSGRRVWRRWVARCLFEAAFSVDAEEGWRAVWDRMCAPGRRGRRSSGAGRLTG